MSGHGNLSELLLARLGMLFADAVADRPDRSHWLGLWNELLDEKGGGDALPVQPLSPHQEEVTDA